MGTLSKEEIKSIYNRPLLDLIFQAAQVHRAHNNPAEVQVSSLISIKTGGCVEDCAYCPQAARYHTDVTPHAMMNVDEVVERANTAKANGSSRLCMGAAWREVRDNRDFDKVLEMVRQVNALGMEVCCTLGMLTEDQAMRLKEAGLYAYNHNLDTSEDYYDKIITTRKYNERLETIGNVQKAGLSVCTGGIIGMGETEDDRIGMLHTLANLDPRPDSVPINALVPVKGTPLENMKRIPVWDMLRTIATARIIMPDSVIRLSAGRMEMSKSEQALCFLCGANSIFAGEKLLTTPNPDFDEDMEMLKAFGLKPCEPFQKKLKKEALNAEVS